mgnify:CR=1 FL=1
MAIAAKKVEQTKVVAQKVKVVAVETATALKTEIENEGLVVVATKAGEVVKEQSVAAYEVAKTEGVETLLDATFRTPFEVDALPNEPQSLGPGAC